MESDMEDALSGRQGGLNHDFKFGVKDDMMGWLKGYHLLPVVDKYLETQNHFLLLVSSSLLFDSSALWLSNAIAGPTCHH